MRLPEQTEALWGLDEDERVVVHEGSDGSEIIVVKGEKTEKYSDFDIQIRLEGGRGYEDMNPPSHPNIFHDLHKKRNADPNAASRLFDIIRSVYAGADPRTFEELASYSFEDDVFPADVTVRLFQLMLIEQEINYGPGGEYTRYHPPRDLLMSCVRWIESGDYDDISQVIGAGYNGRTPEQYRYDGDEDAIWTRPKL